MDFQEISWKEGQYLSNTIKTAVVPIAACEQHGTHLPLGTDYFILDCVQQALIQDLGPDYPAFFLPIIPIGKSPEHLNYFGTISLSLSTIVAIVKDICFSLNRHGMKNIVFLNSHGGNSDLLKSISFDLRAIYDISFYCINVLGEEIWDSKFVNTLFPNISYPEIHAGSLETSVIAYFRPDLIRSAPLPFHPKRDFLSFPFGWRTEDLSDDGTIGDPMSYSKDAGEKAVKYAVQKLHTLFDLITAEK